MRYTPRMERAWLAIALAAVLISACAKSSDGSSKPKDAPSREAPGWAKPGTEDTQPSHALRETLEVLSPERLRVTIHVEGEVRVRTGREKELENWGGESWYETSVSGRVRAALREQFQRLPVAQVESGASEAAERARSELTEAFRDTPFDIRVLSMVRVELPQQYVDAVRAKQEAKTEHERMEAEMKRQMEEMKQKLQRKQEEEDRNR